MKDKNTTIVPGCWMRTKPVAHRRCMCGPIPLFIAMMFVLFVLLLGICIGTYI